MRKTAYRKIVENPYLAITRPFTLFPPFLGIVSGSLAAVGSMVNQGATQFSAVSDVHWHFILVGGLMASILNAASNILNQAAEIDLDRENKPHRVLPQGAMSPRTAIGYSITLYALAMVMAWCVQPSPGMRHTFWCALMAAIATVLYSIKPFYLKSRGWWANVAIAVPRGCLLKVAGWGCVASVWDIEPWFIGFVFMLFLLGSASSKDFADMEGDRKAGVKTLPVRLGIEKTVNRIAPFFVIPWLGFVAGVFLPRQDAAGSILRSGAVPTVLLGLGLSIYGCWTVGLMRKSTRVSVEGNHPAWKHMYLLMMTAQLGLAVCYWM